MESGTFTVRELTSGIHTALNAWFPREVWVQGQIANLSRSPAGHVYFHLVDPGPPGEPPDASIGVVLFAAARQYVNTVLRQAGGVRMADGMSIRIRGRIELFTQQGRLQLRMSGIDPDYTLGLIATDRQRVLEILTREGLAERNRNLTLPPGPLRVGLVTSPGSAAMADFVHELEASGLAWRVVLAPARMQGQGAEHTLVAALEHLRDAPVDVVAIIRGGGAKTDLALFDHEIVARAVAMMPVPVTTGIGHETDTSVTDAVAHSSCKTPTACAARLVEHVRRSIERVDTLWHAIGSRSSVLVQRYERRLDASLASLVRLSSATLERQHQRTIDAERRAARAALAALERAELRLDRDTARVAAVDPERAMARGWSITTDPSGRVVRTARDLTEGQQLVTVLVDGTVVSRVERVELDRRGAVGTMASDG
ncbi:exodeoxyribonuclease VII large subunit [Rhabdothermincola sediminis]|uniref:exodeoxyribonuclease VII large subunit n=1 Tax=Rhabdothermincola sediminis TaxID=2751370 RepID=UPI001AA0A360|nr:exodeoxyribonuclease VII large subunit [Rhabdothermincola sediminis]